VLLTRRSEAEQKVAQERGYLNLIPADYFVSAALKVIDMPGLDAFTT